MAAGPLYSPAVVRELLARYELQADKRFGQNFLIDGHVLASAVQAAGLEPGDTVLEVGPGLGVLTRALAETGASVVSLELDARLLPLLAETLQGLTNVRVLQADALEYDFGELPKDSLLVANLPYNVATPLIVRALESGRFKRLVVMVQKEVAERLSARPGEAAFGALSLVVAHFGRARKLRDVKPGSFFPAPEVTSSLVRIEVNPEARPEPALFELIHTGFRHRRKTLKKNLIMAGYDAAQVASALAQAGLEPRTRAEALSLGEFRSLQALLR